jgi:hypothetical protein
MTRGSRAATPGIGGAKAEVTRRKQVSQSAPLDGWCSGAPGNLHVGGGTAVSTGLAIGSSGNPSCPSQRSKFRVTLRRTGRRKGIGALDRLPAVGNHLRRHRKATRGFLRAEDYRALR